MKRRMKIPPISHLIYQSTSNLSTKVFYAISLSISLLFVTTLFPINFFTGSNPFWYDVRTDPTQHVTGLWAFLLDQWQFPLLYTHFLNAPEGINAAYADIIPLAALIYKPLANFFPEHSHYFGWWDFGTFLLQGFAGAFLLGKLVRYSLLCSITGSLLALYMPSFLIRIAHTALMTQGLILLAIAFYFLTVRNKNMHWIHMLLIPLFLSATIHPYLLAMIYPIYLITLLSYAFQQQKWTYFFLHSSITTFIIGFILWAIGYYSASGDIFKPTHGFDVNSMNLLSPFLGTHLVQNFFISNQFIQLDATGLQIDGHNYLGLSTLFLMIYLLIFHPREIYYSIKKHFLFTFLLIGFTFYSLSNTIYLSDHRLLHYDLPHFIQPLTGTFRSSGRFFWPVGYTLVFGSFLLFINIYKNRQWFIPILLLLVTIQVIDLSPHRAFLDEASHRKTYFKYDFQIMNNLISKHQNVYLFPTYKCGSDYTDPLAFQFFSTYNKKPFNTGFIARAGGHCEEKEKILLNKPQSGAIYFFSQNHREKSYTQKVSKFISQCSKRLQYNSLTICFSNGSVANTPPHSQ